jgi:hypothetical protein
MSRIVITGGPGAGKTTLLLALQARGYTIVGESPRTIIQDRRRRGLSPRPNAYEFAQRNAANGHREFCSSRCDPRARSCLIRTRPHVRARWVGLPHRAGVVPQARPISGHRGTEGFGCRAVYVCGCKRWQTATPNPSLHPTRCGWLRQAPRAGELKRWADSDRACS